MVQEFNIKRENKNYAVKVGVTEDKESILYLEDAEANEDFIKDRWIFKSLFVDTEDGSLTGKVSKIETRWCKREMKHSGNPNEGYQVIEVMITNPEDIKSFINIFGAAILSAMLNGFGRDIMGHNHLPIMDTRPTIDGVQNPRYGLPRLYNEYLESIAPTKDYNSWKTGDSLPEILTEPVG